MFFLFLLRTFSLFFHIKQIFGLFVLLRATRSSSPRPAVGASGAVRWSTGHHPHKLCEDGKKREKRGVLLRVRGQV